MNPKEIKQIQNVCKVVSELKSQLIQELPHYGNQALFFQNDEITTGQLIQGSYYFFIMKKAFTLI
jgi:hypothetical protein